MVDVSPCRDVLHDLAFDLPEDLKFGLDFYSVHRIDTVDYAAPHRGIGHSADYSCGEVGRLPLLHIDPGRHDSQIADSLVASSPNPCILAAADDHFRNAALHHPTTHSAEAVLDIEHELAAPASADCSCCMP